MGGFSTIGLSDEQARLLALTSPVHSARILPRAVEISKLKHRWVFIAPGSTVAGTKITLPDYVQPARTILDSILLKTATLSCIHAACAATSAAYAADTDIASPAGEAVVTQVFKPAVNLISSSEITLDTDTKEEDLLLLFVEVL